MTSSVDGMVSGMDTSGLISQLMQIERAPQNRLKSKVSTETSRTTAFQSINTKLASALTAAETLTKADTWKAVKATSTSDGVTVSATAGAPSGELTFHVDNLATAHVASAVVDPSADITNASGLTFTFGDNTTLTVTPATYKPQDVVDAINAANGNVRAALVTAGTETRLQLTATKTGASGAFTVGGLNAGITVNPAIQGADAKLTVGSGVGAYSMYSANNVFTNVISGVTVTATKAGVDATIKVSSDKDGLANKMQAMVDAANAVSSEIDRYSSYDAASQKSGILFGNAQIRQIRYRIPNAVATPDPAVTMPAGFESFKAVGVQIDKDGKLTFDRTAFLAKYESNPADVKTAVSTGLATQLKNTLKTDNTAVTSVIASRDNYVRSLNKQVDSWDDRLATREAALQRQFANLEKALGSMKNQSSWLAGQLSSLG